MVPVEKNQDSARRKADLIIPFSKLITKTNACETRKPLYIWNMGISDYIKNTLNPPVNSKY